MEYIDRDSAPCLEESQNAEELEYLMEQYGDRILRLCVLYLGDLHLAEDAVQETFLRAWRNAGQFRQESREVTWLTRIAVNVCKSWLRSPWKRRRVSTETEALDSLFPSVHAPEFDDTLPKAIIGLRRPYREVVILYCEIAIASCNSF